MSQTFEFLKRVFRTFGPKQVILAGKSEMDASGDATGKVYSNVVLLYFKNIHL